MAKLVFDESELCNPDVSDLGPVDRDNLEDWVQKFKYSKCYPVVGRLVHARTHLPLLTTEELRLVTKQTNIPSPVSPPCLM